MNKIILIAICLFIVGCKTSSQDVEKSNDPEQKKSSESTPVYLGSWPYNPDKDLISDPGFGTCPAANGCKCDTEDMCPENSECTQLNVGMYCVPKIESRVPRFKGVDQFGDEFDLYDLANQGKPILIEISTPWPQACKDFSAWRSHVSDDVTKQKWWNNKFGGIREIIDNQDVYWVHIIHLDENRNPATAETVRSWYENYPHDNIILLADPEAKMKTWVRPTGYPCLILLDENMNLKVHTLRGIGDAIEEVYKILDSK